MKNVELTCIGCPMGCSISVSVDDNNVISNVEGYSCNVGKKYAENEITNPQRVITSSVRVINGNNPVCSVKTNGTVPKAKVIEYASMINNTTVEAPVRIGDVLIRNIAGSGIDVIATRNVHIKV